ncbi:MAG TPA: glycosyltransferase [Candidatus Nitrosocosmicus sp.]
MIIIYPLILIKKKNKSGLFFFFDRYSIGGAQRIHIDILSSVEDINKLVYFTRKSVNKSLKETFYSLPNTQCRDIHKWCDYLLLRPFTVHYYAFYLNRHNNACVLGANSTFYYDLLPFLNNHIKKYELLHNFTHGKKGMEFFGLANYNYLDLRFIYDTYTFNNIEKQYAQYEIPNEFLERIRFIEPGVDIPGKINKEFKFPIKILYAGRGGVQKRINLLNKIAVECIERKWPVQFHFAGTMISELNEKVKQNSVIHGEISDKTAMNNIYEQTHIILMTSAYEGFPMLIKEGMAYGCVPLVTALEGNKMHLKHRFNSLLIEAVENGTSVINEGVELIGELIKNMHLLINLSEEAYSYAKEKFKKQLFIEQYRKYLSP